jgi:hypothetical protein
VIALWLGHESIETTQKYLDVRLRERLVGAGLIHHQHLIFTASGAPMVDLQYAYWRWQPTLQRLTIRYRNPTWCVTPP